MDTKRLLPFALFAGLLTVRCGQEGRAQTVRASDTVRVATYNLQWFSEDADPGRIANIKAVLKEVDADVMGFQEVQSAKALRQVLDDRWDVAMVDDPEDQQETAVAVRKPYVLAGFEPVFPSPSLDGSFPGARDVLRATVQTPDGKALFVHVVHMKSRRGGRATTDPARTSACGLLAAYLRGKTDEPAVVMGDFNDAPDDASLNVLESGDLMATGGPNVDSQRLMVNLTESLAARDFVTIDLQSLYQGRPMTPVVPGAQKDNARLRGQDYEFPRDVRVPQAFFDQILATPALASTVGNVKVYAVEAALRGRKGRTVVTENGVDYAEKGDLASDHLPVSADLKLP